MSRLSLGSCHRPGGPWVFLMGLGLVSMLWLCSTGSAEELGDEEIVEVVKAVAAVFESKYVFPDQGREMAGVLRDNLEKDIYASLSSGRALAMRLMQDLQSVSGDRHAAVFYAPERIQRRNDPVLREEAEETDRRLERMRNYGFEEIRILSGNIGYLKLNSFAGGRAAFETAVAAMQFLSNCDATIVDLRFNQGGESAMCQLLCSYFLEGEPELLDVFHYRQDGRIKQMWSLPFVPGRSLHHADLYLLTSPMTFSAAEGMAYDLQALGRAVIVGERTAGGGHAVTVETVAEKFMVIIPYARSVNPVTETNFNLTGVKPDVEVAHSQALEKCHILALKRRLEKEPSERIKAALEWAVDGLGGRMDPGGLPMDLKKSYVGIYGPYHILLEDDRLIFQLSNGEKIVMVPIDDDYFMFDETEDFRLKILRSDGFVSGIRMVYENGSSVNHQRK